MDMITLRRRIQFDSMMLGNYYMPSDALPNNTNYTVTAGKNWVKVQKSTSTSSSYGRASFDISNWGFVSGKKYKAICRIKDFSSSNLTGFMYIADSNSNIKASSTQLNTVHVGDKLEMDFVYAPSIMKEFSLYMNRGFNVSLGTYIEYSDIVIL